MSLKLNAGAAISFILKQEYQRFYNTWGQVQEHAKQEGLLPPEFPEGQPCPTWEEWLKQNELVNETSEILDTNGEPILKN